MPLSRTSAGLTLSPGAIRLRDLRTLLSGPQQVELAGDWRNAVCGSARAVQSRLDAGAVMYGINTGFGLLANTRIARDKLDELQLSLVRSHAAGTGEQLPAGVVRLVIALKAASLARGYSGVRPVIVDRLLELLNGDVLPCVPSQGSVGASGDLAPLAHLTLTLLGEGEAVCRGIRMPSQQALAESGLAPLTLAPKEGLALLNGTQVSTALALKGLFEAEDLLTAAVIVGAMSVEAALGSHVPFEDAIHRLRGHGAQIDAAAAFRILLPDTEIARSHAGCDRVQDPYSLRCQPQVLGACLAQLRHAAAVLEIEANAVTDNPIVFAASGRIVSGGNFHAEPVAMAADAIALAIAEIGALSERRTALLVDPHLSRLPPFLVGDSGVNSGFMLAQVTAAALASENKTFAHPASVDSLPTSANQEDHVSMATFAARRLGLMAENTRGVVAIEWLAAAQGIDLRRPLRSSPPIEQAHALLRAHVPFWDRDRCLAPDIEAARRLTADDDFLALASGPLVTSRQPANGMH